jgi:hypothetical protein
MDGESCGSDLDRAILPPELTARRGSVTVTLPLPRYIIAKQLASGKVAIFHRSHEVSDTRMSDCHEPLGADHAAECGLDGNGGRAAVLNAPPGFEPWEWRNQNQLAYNFKAHFGKTFKTRSSNFNSLAAISK